MIVNRPNTSKKHFISIKQLWYQSEAWSLDSLNYNRSRYLCVLSVGTED